MTTLSNKIMIVDDNILDQMITKQVLKKYYMQSDVLVMDGSLQALNYLEINENNIGRLPNLIILDLDMPNMNGFEFLETFSNYTDELKQQIKIIVLTSTDIVEHIEQLNANPAVSSLIFKPLFQESLAEVL